MLYESLRMAVNSLLANKMRSILTMLGIIVGIGSVIAIISLGEGGKSAILGQFNDIGASTIMVMGRQSRAGEGELMDAEDIEVIREQIPEVQYIAPEYTVFGSAKLNEKTNMAVLVGYGKDASYFYPINILHGRPFTELDHNANNASIVIDVTGAKSLFGYENVVGESLSINYNSKILKGNIIGVAETAQMQMATDMQSGQMGQLAGDHAERIPVLVYIPFDKILELTGDNVPVSTLAIMTTDPTINEYIGNQVIRILETRHNNAGKDVYMTRNLADILDQVDSVLGLITDFISAVAGISLLVGGIGVMNIMLVSVTERTAEIGIRKALGATKGDILMQFLTESVILTLIGGILGITFGFLLANSIANYAGFSAIILPETVILAVLFSSIIGLFFGIYPARRAATMHPIDALRYQ